MDGLVKLANHAPRYTETDRYKDDPRFEHMLDEGPHSPFQRNELNPALDVEREKARQLGSAIGGKIGFVPGGYAGFRIGRRIEKTPFQPVSTAIGALGGAMVGQLAGRPIAEALYENQLEEDATNHIDIPNGERPLLG